MLTYPMQIDVESVVPFHQTSDEDFSRVFDVNARGAFLLSKMIAPVMASQEPYTVETNRFGTRQLSRGAIVHIASAMAFGAVPCKTPYITAKHALLGITRSSGTYSHPDVSSMILTLVCSYGFESGWSPS
jgi:NAD(P)-dependent dehydrogenase (short-subunit alcohol dehydrogenase family)